MTRRIALCSNHEMSNLIWGHPLFSSSQLRLLRLSSTAPKHKPRLFTMATLGTGVCGGSERGGYTSECIYD